MKIGCSPEKNISKITLTNIRRLTHRAVLDGHQVGDYCWGVQSSVNKHQDLQILTPWSSKVNVISFDLLQSENRLKIQIGEVINFNLVGQFRA